MTKLPAFMTGIVKKLRRSANFTRAHERLTCSAIGEVFFIKRGCTIRGVVDEVSRGGLRLRPSQSFIVKRSDEDVRVSIGRFELDATIVNTSSGGYGFRLKKMLEAEDLEEIKGLSYQ